MQKVTKVCVVCKCKFNLGEDGIIIRGNYPGGKIYKCDKCADVLRDTAGNWSV